MKDGVIIINNSRGPLIVEQDLYDALESGKVAAAALEQGLIVITAGADVLRFVPPLVIEKQHVDEMIEKLEKALLSVQE